MRIDTTAMNMKHVVLVDLSIKVNKTVVRLIKDIIGIFRWPRMSLESLYTAVGGGHSK